MNITHYNYDDSERVVAWLILTHTVTSDEAGALSYTDDLLGPINGKFAITVPGFKKITAFFVKSHDPSTGVESAKAQVSMDGTTLTVTSLSPATGMTVSVGKIYTFWVFGY